MLASFFDELEKIAYSLADMRKVLQLSAKKAIRLPRRLIPMGPVALPAGATGAQRAAATASAAAGHISPQQLAATQKLLGETSGKMLVPKKSGGVVGWVKSMGVPEEAVPKGKARMAAESLLRGHELDELALGARKVNLPYLHKATHVSPDVILRERNRLVTMPESVRGDVADLIAPLRGLSEAPILEKATRTVSGQGLPYAGGPRLSRHARKKISKRTASLGEAAQAAIKAAS